MFKKGDTPVAGYTLVDFLGRGQYGEVWGAMAPGGTEVAMKFIALQSNSGAVELKALRAVKLIRHPNLVSINAIWVLDSGGNVLDDATLDRLSSGSSHQTIKPNQTLLPEQVSSDNESAFLVIAMAKADKSLEDRLKEAVQEEDQQGIPLDELCDYIDQAATGLDFLNEERHWVDGKKRGVIHRDVKPANLLLVGTAVVVGDFGVATTLKDFDATATSLSGSIGFMSPESIARKPSPTTDQYALAISYYWMRTNTLPYAETISMDKLLEIHRTGALNFDFVGEDERKILQKATATDPKKRYGNCRELAKALKELQAGKATSVQPVRSSLPIWMVATCIVVLAAVIGIVAMLQKGDDKTADEGKTNLKDNDETPEVRPVVIPERTLTLEPKDIQFEISYFDSEGKQIVASATKKYIFPLANDSEIEIQSLGKSAIWKPFAKTKLTASELADKSWSINLIKKSQDEIRTEALVLVEAGESPKAQELIKAAHAEYPSILNIGQLRKTQDVSGAVDHVITITDSDLLAFSSRTKLKNAPNLIAMNDGQPRLVQVAGEQNLFIESMFTNQFSKQVYVLRANSIESIDVSSSNPTQTELWSSKKTNARLICGAVSNDGNIVAIGDRDGAVHLIKTDSSGSQQETSVSEEAITRLISGEKTFLAIDQDDTFVLLRHSTGTEIQKQDFAVSFDSPNEEVVEIVKTGKAGITIATDQAIYHCGSIDIESPNRYENHGFGCTNRSIENESFKFR